MPYAWWKRFNDSDVEVSATLDHPVDRGIVDVLYRHFEDFRKA